LRFASLPGLFFFAVISVENGLRIKGDWLMGFEPKMSAGISRILDKRARPLLAAKAHELTND